jgi:hypothetical protein
MVETTRQLVPAPADSLHAELRALIASSRQRLAGAVSVQPRTLIRTPVMTVATNMPHVVALPSVGQG